MLGAEGVKQLQTEQPQIFQKPEVTPQVTENLTPDNSVVSSQVASLLGLASLETGRYSQEIADVIDWAKANGAKSLEDIIYEIRFLTNKLGNNPNEKKIKTISRYVYLSGERNKLNTEIERMQTL
jgi:hypothetical protein